VKSALIFQNTTETLANQATHQESHGDCKTNDGQWPLANALAGLRNKALLHRLPSLAACHELVCRLMHHACQPIDRAVGSMVPGINGTIGMLG
jgi:hypothetical protein